MHPEILSHWIKLIGYAGVAFIIFAETGLFFGFFLPGDSLLFTIGLLAAQNFFKIGIIIPLLIISAVVGYILAYWFGNKLGHWLEKRPDSFWFKKKYLHNARIFYGKHGGKALILGRLLPIIRTFLPIIAGMADMPLKRYYFFNFLGAIIWVCAITLAGYYLGSTIPNIEKYLLPISLGIILISLTPLLFKFFNRPK